MPFGATFDLLGVKAMLAVLRARGMFDIVVTLFIGASLPVCLLQPWLGAVLWGWLDFMYPFRAVNGLAFGMQLSWLVVVAVVAGLAVARERYWLPPSREMQLLLALWAFCGLTTIVVAAVYPKIAWAELLKLSKTLLMTLVVMALSLERRKLTLLMWVTALPLGGYAAIGAVWILLTGGAHPLYGFPTSDIENNNDLAAALVAVVPFFAFLGRNTPRRWVRYGALLLFGATVVAILGTYSRAAVLALGVVMVLLGVSRPWRAVAVAGLAWALFLLFTTPQTWLSRVDSIRTYQLDRSASMRLPEWYVAVRIGLDHPLLGAGFRPFSPAAYERYIPGYSDYHDAHNMFLQVFAEHGFPGLALYIGLIVSTLATLRRTERRPQAETGSLQDYARMLQIGLVGYVVDGMFQCLSYRAIFFHLLGLSMMVDALARAPAHLVGPTVRAQTT